MKVDCTFVVWVTFAFAACFSCIAQSQVIHFDPYGWLELWKYRPRRVNDSIPQFSNWIGSRMHDGTPFLVTSKYSQKESIFCLFPKSGSTTFKYLFTMAGWGLVQINPNRFFNNTFHSLIVSTVDQFQSALQKKDVPRFLIVRNPYFRILSGFLHLRKVSNYLDYFPPNYNKSDSIGVTVGKLTAYHKRMGGKLSFNDHFRLQSTNCNPFPSMTYDYVLPLEEMAFWYEPLMPQLSLEMYARTKWNTSKHSEPCFYHPPHKTCEKVWSPPFNSSTTWEEIVPICKMDPHERHVFFEHIHEMGVNYANHSTSAMQHTDEHFSSPAILRAVTQYVKPDLLAYGYPEWQVLNETHVESTESYVKRWNDLIYQRLCLQRNTTF